VLEDYKGFPIIMKAEFVPNRIGLEQISNLVVDNNNN
jgi:hypothetical protein